MASRNWLVPAIVLTALAAGGIGFGASYVWENRAIEKVTAERDAARNCRHTAATLPPCPVIYRNTRIEWQDRIKTVQTPDPRQATRIAALSAELADARHTIRNLARRQRWLRPARAYAWQNGTMQYPYYTDDRCPSGSVVVYDAGLSAMARHSGDPNVCYVLTKLHRLALSSPRH